MSIDLRKTTLNRWRRASGAKMVEFAGDDAYLYRTGENDYLLVVNAANREKDWTYLQEQSKDFDGVTLEDHTEGMAMIAFQGPLSRRILDQVTEGGALPEPFRNRFSEMTLCGTAVLVSRTEYTGEPVGFELFVPAGRAEDVWSELYQVGKAQGVLPAGLGARDTLRLEAGLPLYGHELGIDPEGNEIPGFAFPLSSVAVSFSPCKRRYIGRDSLAWQFELVKRLRTGLSQPSGILPRRIKPLALLDRGSFARAMQSSSETPKPAWSLAAR